MLWEAGREHLDWTVWRGLILTPTHGESLTNQKTVLIVSTNHRSDVPSLKMAVTSPAVVAHDGALYVTGGAILEDGDGIELVQKYDNKTGRWTEVAGMLIPRSGSAACVLNGYIYVVGGWHASTENTNKVER